MANNKDCKIFHIHPVLVVLIYLFTIISIAGCFLAMKYVDLLPINIGIYAVAAALLFLSAFILPSTIKRLKSFISNKAHPLLKNKHFERYTTDYEYKTLLGSIISMTISLGFAIYYLVYGIVFDSGWYLAMSIYAFALTILRLILFLVGIITENTITDNNRKDRINSIWWLIDSVLMLLLNLLLIAPITLIAMLKKELDGSLILSIFIATYAFYKITMSTINFVKARKSRDITTKFFRDINITDALVTMLSLTYTLISVNSRGEIVGEMRFVVIAVAFVSFATAITLSILTIIRTAKNYKEINKK